MILNLPFLAQKVRRLLAGRYAPIQSAAARSWTLCPEETAEIRPAIFAEGAPDKVLKLSPWRNWEAERLLIAGGTIEHAASRAFLLEGAAIFGPTVYKGASKAEHGFGRESVVSWERPEHVRLDRARLVCNSPGNNYFGHQLLDNYPLELVAGAGGPPVVVASKPYAHDAGYRALLDLPKPPEIRRARVGELTIFTDYGQNSYKAERYRELRRRLRAALAPAAGARRAGVYVKRGATGEPRILVNEAQMEERLTALGFDVVEPARLDAAEIARRTLDAPIVVSVEGSHISHAIFTIADDGAFLVLQPPDRFAMGPYKEFADCLDIRFGFVVGDPAEGGFTVDPDEVEAVLEKLDHARR